MKFYKIGLHFKILMMIRRISDNAILQYYYILKVNSYKNMQISQTFSASEKKKIKIKTYGSYRHRVSYRFPMTSEEHLIIQLTNGLIN